MENLTIKLIDSTFFLFLPSVLGVAIWFYLLQNTSMKADSVEDITKQIFSIVLLIIIIIITVIILVTYWLDVEPVFLDHTNKIYDISNWVTLIVEIAIGFSIAIIILIYSRFKGKEDTERIVTATSEIITDVKKSPTTPQSIGYFPTENDNSGVSSHNIFENLDHPTFQESQIDENLNDKN